ncbi:CaiB/BaiF CoA transferase family protein [Desulfothermus sp.]
MQDKNKDYPLKDLVVLEVAQAVAGPMIGTLLGDLGANVIHIERPGVGDLARNWIPKRKDLSFYFAVVNRNKRSLTLNLSNPQGRDIFLNMVKKADVIIENFRPGVVEKWGIDYPTVKEINPKIIYCHVSGYGQDGPYRDRAAFDQVMQGEAGIISYTGTKDVPCKINVPVTDYVAALYGTYAVLVGLLKRQTTGKGMEVEVSLFDSAVNIMLNLLNMSVVEGLDDSELRMGAKYHLATPYEPYLAGDNKYVNICVAMEPHWVAFCKAIGMEDLATDSRFETNEKRLKNRNELEKIILKKLKEKSAKEWIKIFNNAGVPCGAVNSIKEVLEHPQLKHRKTIQEIEYPGIGKIKMFNNPVKFSDFEVDITRPPKLGEHTDEILKEFGYTDNEIKGFKEKDII